MIMCQADFSRGLEVGGRCVLTGAMSAGLPLGLLGSSFLNAWDPLAVMFVSFGVTVIGGAIAFKLAKKNAGA